MAALGDGFWGYCPESVAHSLESLTGTDPGGGTGAIVPAPEKVVGGQDGEWAWRMSDGQTVQIPEKVAGGQNGEWARWVSE